MAQKSTNIHWHQNIPRDERWGILGSQGLTLWFTGLSASGKSTIASLVEKKVLEAKKHTYLLDGDNIRFGINSDLGFSHADRAENIRRVGEVAKLFADSGAIAIVSLISPIAEERNKVRASHVAGEINFVEVFVDTPIEECERRDPKGLYKKARAGEIPNFTGISAPYEAPENPELRLTIGGSVEECAEAVLTFLREKNFINF
eukprot:TRINITY_DN1285_c0_g1_i1.p1 TRINITY_DN1285_c0_g1~~TRINITY_DN1285_c0_g1_i1.p1  ORF type:complete len:216 (+),score=100.80 TRINITY_DN1285_c0_g1_i1:42-650(+)